MSEQSLLFPNEVARKHHARERRVWARFPSKIGSTCQPIAAETAAEPEMGWAGEIIDISRGGFGLALERRFEPGTPLVIELVSDGDEPPRLFEVDVIRTREADGRWIHGCEFRKELSEQDLQALL
jgi:hypothetical protein